MGFFADLPEPPRDATPSPFALRRPEWTGPPENVLPGVLGTGVVLVNTGALAVAVPVLAVWPTGALVTLELRRREYADGGDLDPFTWRHGPPQADGLRFGVGFSDGRKALGEWPGRPAGPPERPVLLPRGGHGGGLSYEQELWLWPLPPDGPVELVCEWPAQGVGEARATLDGGELRAAAARAIELWPDDRPLAGPDDEW